jgi:hypothetical protein
VLGEEDEGNGLPLHSKTVWPFPFVGWATPWVAVGLVLGCVARQVRRLSLYFLFSFSIYIFCFLLVI